MESLSEGALSAADAAAFSQVVQAFVAARAGRPAGQRELSELYRLVADWGAGAVQSAMADLTGSGVVMTSVGQVAACLEQDDPALRQIVRLYVEEIAPHQRITPRVRDLLVAMKCEFPETEHWNEAVSRAVAANRRTLAAVDTLLRRHKDTGSWDPAPRQRKRDHGRAKDTARGPASRETKYPEAGSQPDGGGQRPTGGDAVEKWKVPEGLF